MAGSFLLISFAIFAMVFGFDRFGSQQEEPEKWRHEKALLPIRSGGMQFTVEAEVRWNPETNEIQRENVGDTGFSEDDWVEVTRHTKLYNKLLRNFKNKYSTPQADGERTQWTKAS